jgi:hypothetical protein
MATRRLRSIVSRIVLVAALVAILAAGAITTGGPAKVSAKPVDCSTQMNIAWGYLAIANVMDNLGYTQLYWYYYGKYESLADAFYPC